MKLKKWDQRVTKKGEYWGYYLQRHEWKEKCIWSRRWRNDEGRGVEEKKIGEYIHHTNDENSSHFDQLPI